MNRQRQDEWSEAKRLCRLSDEELRMARELGLQPKSLIKNIPSPSQQWKAPVRDWVTSLYEQKFGSRQPETRPSSEPGPMPPDRPHVIEFRNPEHPWPDKPEIPELVLYEPIEFGDDDDEEDADWYGNPFENRFEPPADEEVDEENTRMLRRQCLFRWAAQSVTVAMSALPEIQKVAAFGAVAQPLEMEVPRFRQFRRHRIDILHECADLDLAVWTADLTRLKELKRAMARGLSLVQDTPYGGVAHHQVDVHVLDAGNARYGGGLCIFGQCPKPGKRECLVPGCGAQLFLQQYEKYRFKAAQFEAAPKVILFDRAGGFLVRPPRIDATPTRIVHRARRDEEGRNEDPF